MSRAVCVEPSGADRAGPKAARAPQQVFRQRLHKPAAQRQQIVGQLDKPPL